LVGNDLDSYDYVNTSRTLWGTYVS